MISSFSLKVKMLLFVFLSVAAVTSVEAGELDAKVV